MTQGMWLNLFGVSFGILGALLVGIGQFCLAREQKSDDQKAKKEIIDMQIKTSTADIQSRREIYKNLANFYSETRDKILKGEIPVPANFSDFIKAPHDALLDDRENFLKNLDAIKGLDVEKQNMEFQKMTADAAAFNADLNLRTKINNFIGQLETIIKYLNEKQTFGGRIKSEFKSTEKENLVVMQDKNGQSYQVPERIDMGLITFPSGNRWNVFFRRKKFFLNSPSRDSGVTIAATTKGFRPKLFNLKKIDGKFVFVLANSVGSVEPFVELNIQKELDDLFAQEMKKT